MERDHRGVGTHTKVIPNEVFFEEVIKHLNLGKSVVFHVSGNSMLPFLKHGEKILLCPLKSDSPTVGEIILSRSSYGIVLHRVVRIKNGKIWLAGDGNLAQHEIVEKDQLLGVMTAVIRNGKNVYLDTKSKKILGLFWYYLRPFRIVFSKLFGIK